VKISRTAVVPVSVWVTAATMFFSSLLLAAYFHQQFQLEKKYNADNNFAFHPERLQRLRQNGIVVIGTSLVKFGFFYDKAFEQLAREKGINLQFVRFVISGNRAEKYRGLFEKIRKYRPKLLFLQAELFFIQADVKKSEHVFNEKFMEMVSVVHGHFHFIFGKLASLFTHRERGNVTLTPPPQSDEDILEYLNKVADKKEIYAESKLIINSSPKFPPFVEEYMRYACTHGTQVVLLEMNRSKEGNESLGEVFRKELTKRLQQVATLYDIPFFKFRGDLSYEYYADRAHLNKRGRGVFCDWFLNMLSKRPGGD